MSTSNHLPSFKNAKVGDCLYDPRFEHDACGIGFIVDIQGRRSHALLRQALTAVANMAHRGAVADDGQTGDGAGILVQVPYRLLAEELAALGKEVPPPGALGVGMIFLPRDLAQAARCRAYVEAAVHDQGLRFLAWRPVPVEPAAIGSRARACRPQIEQALIARPDGLDEVTFERRLLLARKVAERHVRQDGLSGFYVASMSARTILYKGMLLSPQLPRFYLDLSDPRFETALAVFHQRYSTNTFPNWERAQPFRMLCHNGEINTLQGNINWMRAREPHLRSSVWGDQVEVLRPVIDLSGSDSAMLDNALELLVLSGRDIRHALMMLIPEAWQNVPEFDPDLRAFYRYHACLIEPWDGPAGVIYTDGRIVGACLDRNGLRPVRYLVTHDGLALCASETGVLDIEPSRIAIKGKLGPGQMIAVDTEAGQFLGNEEIKRLFARQRPYGRWLSLHLASIAPVSLPSGNGHGLHSSLMHLQAAFGYTSEELAMILKPMAQDGHDPVGSMGDDTPLAALSDKPRPLFNYFKQRFAEVTNPPIDPLRERMVMSLHVLLGRRGSLLEESPEHARLIELSSPILQDDELEALRRMPHTATISALWPVAEGAAGLERAVQALCQAAEAAVDTGASVLILSDRDVDAERAPIPSLLAVGAVHHHLIRQGKRMLASLVVETGEAREVHHAAALIGYGASAVNPYLALASARAIAEEGRLRNKELTADQAAANFVHALEKGILKVMSKMGISTVDSYCGAQIFEALGLREELVERCFTGTPLHAGDVGFEQIAQDVLQWHEQAFGGPKPRLDHPGYYKPRKDGEYHAFNQTVVEALHKAVRHPAALNGRFSEGFARYREYADLANHPPVPTDPRHLLRLRSDRSPIPIEEVEPIESIVRRFSTAAVSHGAISIEAHETLAIAMNRLGAASNSGEGGEDPARYGTERNSKIKQVASGRFGVTPAYLMSAEELQIKMAQGSKPGEGGQIPGHKVTEEIARIRHTVPGVALISPPPHHDIYSIEDLAQLIYDLKQINPEARVSVKLVAQMGVGTIAAGVAKGYADTILISGHSGGTGASPLGSIKNAGIPWELGLAETQQTLILNGLRGRVRLRADGGLRTGRDVLVAALLGADEYSFGTSALIAEGCIMARVCHLNTCPTGVATQDPELRKKFAGTPEQVMAFFRYVAEEVRELLAHLGYRSLDEVIGRVDLLEPIENSPLDLRRVVATPDPSGAQPIRNMAERNPLPAGQTLNDRILQDAMEAVEYGHRVRLSYQITNADRTVGARLAGAIAREFGDDGLPEGTIEIEFHGSAGQSFGAFCIAGMRLLLIGDANDYVGKGMSGGEIAIRPPATVTYPWHEAAIVGNTVLYGATGGALYVAGRAGERFAVRNSGAVAVVEGVGDHGCEYMTGGAVVILGETGWNFGAGMTGGVAYVFDPPGRFRVRYNPELIFAVQLKPGAEAERVRELIQRHLELTGSPRAREILEHWDECLGQFWAVHPKTRIAQIEAANEGTVVRELARA
ncbi:MAG: glutamate synthase large subunit [Anaerolineae bacterium]|nr:glutamate synthase large subunit [Anaerolineae bacterium]MDW8101112.1 glutamate synthase large subunit [Anaerolineae bacterium]